FSLARHRPTDFTTAASFAAALVSAALERGREALPPGTLLNVNMPPGAFTGYQVTRLGRRVYRDQVVVREDLRGRAYYWIGGPEGDGGGVAGSGGRGGGGG